MSDQQHLDQVRLPPALDKPTMEMAKELLSKLGADIQEVDQEFYIRKGEIEARYGWRTSERDELEFEGFIRRAWRERCERRQPMVEQFEYLARQIALLGMSMPLYFVATDGTMGIDNRIRILDESEGITRAHQATNQEAKYEHENHVDRRHDAGRRCCQCMEYLDRTTGCRGAADPEPQR